MMEGIIDDVAALRITSDDMVGLFQASLPRWFHDEKIK